MSKRVHLSGSLKRKLKSQRIEKEKSLLRISAFFNKDSCANNSSLNTTPVETTDIAQSFPSPSTSSSIQIPNIQGNSELTTIDINNVNDENECSINSDLSEAIHSMTLGDHSNDKAFFTSALNTSDKIFIISKGPCQPDGPFPKKIIGNKNRSFSAEHYYEKSQGGVSLHRKWICYSKSLDLVYCQPCWLFCTSSSWTNGINDWKHISEKIKLHEKSLSHINACLTADRWEKNNTLSEDLKSQINIEVGFWRQVIKRIINVTLTLGIQNLSFRGHNEKINSENRGNFLAIIDLLAKYDPVLSELLQRGPKKISYLSPTIQNEIVDMLSECVKKSIISDVQKVPFFSYITDTTQDIRKQDQMSQIIRYVVIEKNEDNKPIKLRIEESFLGFCLLNDHSASGFSDKILENIKNYRLDIGKLRGQDYDGAAVMAGVYNGVQTKIKAHCPLTEYIHCNAHNLNLVLNDTMNASIEIQNFFAIIQKIYVYFALSGKRWKILTEILPVGGVTLKKVCSTRWSSRHQAISPIRYEFLSILKALTKITLLSKNKEEILEAEQILKNLENFNFVLTLVIISAILRKVDGVSQFLQRSDVDLHTATGLLQTLTSELKIMRKNFLEYFTEATNLSRKWGIASIFKNQRHSKKKIFFYEICEDQRLESPEKKFEVEVFNLTLDRGIIEMERRFQSFNYVSHFFKCLQPISFIKLNDEELYKSAETLQKKYNQDISPDFVHQILSFRSCFKDIISTKLKTTKEIAEMLFIEHSPLTTTYPDVCTAFILYLTLPITVAAAERSFSKLKIIKNYLRSTMSEERLSGLSIISIGNKRAQQLNLDEVIDKFAQVKARKVNF